MLRKVLIANRGEIAVRIVRACAELGITSVAVFTDADRHALHVKKADEAYNLGPDSVAGYLNVHRIVNLAVATGCDAIHPGYGFLSENPELARCCELRQVIFVGPSADVIAKMGDKLIARELMIQAGVPVVPGSKEPLKNIRQAIEFADSIGYPVMLKATNGGGGRGIRKIESSHEMESQFDRVISESEKAFGRPDIFVEKCIERPRHIEIQVLADSHGKALHLFERDCSIQRRHQKLIEIAPSPAIDEKTRAKISRYALQAVKAVGYENAGTVEFLLDEQGDTYFMEMNTRLQVEHTVTEEITGIDIVQEQMKIAAGQPLQLEQEHITYRGIAMQFRINAEDPQNNFLPSFGKISKYYAPGGPGVRTDSAIYTGYDIPPHYDSLCAKLTVWAFNWPTLIARADRALREMGVFGVKTTIAFYREILANEDFLQAKFDTTFIELHPELCDYSNRAKPDDLAAVITAAIAAHLGT